MTLVPMTVLVYVYLGLVAISAWNDCVCGNLSEAFEFWSQGHPGRVLHSDMTFNASWCGRPLVAQRAAVLQILLRLLVKQQSCPVPRRQGLLNSRPFAQGSSLDGGDVSFINLWRGGLSGESSRIDSWGCAGSRHGELSRRT